MGVINFFFGETTMPSNVVPTLSTDGWVDSPVVKADRLFAHFFTAMYLQSSLYSGSVASMTHIVQNNTQNPYGTAEEIRLVLDKYFSRYYEKVTVDANWEAVPNSSKAEINIYVELVDSDNITINLANLVTLVDSKVEKVTKLNNG